MKTNLKRSTSQRKPIFNAEICAIDLVLDLISRNNFTKYVIFFDSLSIITAIANKKLDNPLLTKLIIRLNELGNGKEIVLCGKENELADSVAKVAQNDNSDKKNFRISWEDLKRTISK